MKRKQLTKTYMMIQIEKKHILINYYVMSCSHLRRELFILILISVAEPETVVQGVVMLITWVTSLKANIEITVSAERLPDTFRVYICNEQTKLVMVKF